MNMSSGIALYNQNRLSDENFVENFVARLDLLEILLGSLRRQADGGETEHQILIGARGMGKTAMLRRVSIAIMADESLRHRWVPLRFREEQYNVISLAAFWRNCGESLAEWCEANERESDAARLDAALETAGWRDPESAASSFLDACGKLERRPVLLIDNLDLILTALSEQECWLLRGVLQKRNGPVVIGAAPRFLTQGGDRGAPFYEFFQPHVMEPLAEAELLRCIHALAEMRGEAGLPVKAILAKEPERLRTLYTLTGGNPRILALIYQLLERAESDTIFADLEVLLDQVTPFYKARVEEYQTSQQRAVIDAIALHWDPITSNLLSKTTGIEVTTISSQLNRLKKDGFIEEVPSSGARSGYQLCERFLNIWYLMRHGTRRTKQRLRWLTIFLMQLFSASELGAMASEARGDKRDCAWHPDFRRAVLDAYEELGRLRSEDLSALAGRDVLRSYPTNAAPPAGLGQEAGGTERAGIDVEMSRAVDQARKLLIEVSNLQDMQKHDDVIFSCNYIISRFGENNYTDIQLEIAAALIFKCISLDALGRSEEEIGVYEDIVMRFGDSDQLPLKTSVAIALVNKAATFGALGRGDEAIATYDDVIARFGNSDDSALRERVARALINKGGTHVALGRGEEAIATYEDLVARFLNSDEPALEALVAMALVNKAITLGSLGRSEDEIALYSDIIARFCDSEQPALQEQVAISLINKGSALGAVGRSKDELAIYDDIVARFGGSNRLTLQTAVAMAIVNKGVRLGALRRREETIATYDDVIARFGKSGEAALQEQVAIALVNKGVRLGAYGQSEQAIATYDDVIARFSDSGQLTFRQAVAMALVNKGIAFGTLGRREEEIDVYDDVIARFDNSIEPASQEGVARALVNKGIALGALGRNEEAIATFDNVIIRFGSSAKGALQGQVALALTNKGVLLDAFDRSVEAIAIYDDVVARFGNSDEAMVREQVGRALTRKGKCLFDRFNDALGAEAAYRHALQFSGDDLSVKRNLAWVLIGLGRLNEAAVLRSELADLPDAGLLLLNAGIELARDNFGLATEQLEHALNKGVESDRSDFFEDLLWLLRLGAEWGHGERLIEWLEASGHAERYAPVHGALVAYVRGERFLLDINPETRGPARMLFDRMSAWRRKDQSEAPSRKRGGRPRKRRAAGQ